MNIKVKKALQYGKRNGFLSMVYMALEQLSPKKIITEDLLPEDDTREILPCVSPENALEKPRISILVPAYETKTEYLREMIDSVISQTYGEFELCIADGSRSDSVKKTVEQYQKMDKRIRYLHLEQNEGISENTNRALEMATGEYVALLDHDDLLAPEALEEVVQEIAKGKEVVYTDEDKTDSEGKEFFSPHIKPDFNLDLLLSNNYICHFFVVKTSIAKAVGGFRSEFNGAQDYDFILRCIEESGSAAIGHVRKILYHWRAHSQSTAENPQSKRYAYEAGRQVLKSYLKRRELEAEVNHTRHLGFYRIEYKDTNRISKEEYILLLDDELSPITKEYEQKLAVYLNRKEIGAAGGKIYDRRHRILCAGLRKTSDGNVKSYFEKMNGHFSGYMHRASLQQDVPAVSMRAMLIRKELYTEGLSEYELCESVRKKGYLIVFDPSVEFKEKKWRK